LVTRNYLAIELIEHRRLQCRLVFRSRGAGKR
jgi:hypothetical protein